MNNEESILLVDDDEIFLGVLAKALGGRGFDVTTATGIAEAVRLAHSQRPAKAVVDLKLKGESGLDLIPGLAAIRPDMNIVVLTGYSSIATAVTAIKRGAAEYLSKPVTADDVIRALSGEPRSRDELEDFSPMSIERLEWEHIQKVLKENDGNISATARSLGMYRRTLQRKLAKRPVPE
ncbi:MAG: response regulator transcription factor [Lysobacterales bacterium]|jgi:two-component system response regulator RegA